MLYRTLFLLSLVFISSAAVGSKGAAQTQAGTTRAHRR